MAPEATECCKWLTHSICLFTCYYVLRLTLKRSQQNHFQILSKPFQSHYYELFFFGIISLTLFLLWLRYWYQWYFVQVNSNPFNAIYIFICSNPKSFGKSSNLGGMALLRSIFRNRYKISVHVPFGAPNMNDRTTYMSPLYSPFLSLKCVTC